MSQDERWMALYNEESDFIEAKHRNHSKGYDEEKLMVHFLKRNRKLMNVGELPADRVEKYSNDNKIRCNDVNN